MIDKAFKIWSKAKPYLVPYFLIPLSVVYLIDYLKFLLELMQWGIVLALTFLFAAFLTGISLHLLGHKKSEVILSKRFVTFVPTLKWGYDLMDWLMGEC